MDVLVTGGLGYVGSRLVPYLEDCGHVVRILDLNLYNSANGRHFINGDIRDVNAVRQAVSGVEAVIHLAAISNDPTGNVDDVLTRQVNFDAVGMLVSEAKKAGVKRFINASSSSVFGAQPILNVTEEVEPGPMTAYSKYKALAEWVVNAASDPFFCTVNVRPATICGWSPRQRFDLVVNKFTADAVTKKEITVHGGEQRRPSVTMTDMILLYEKLLGIESKLINGKTFNFGFENLKVIEIARLVATEVGNTNIRMENVVDLRDYHISSKKVLEELQFKPLTDTKFEIKNLADRMFMMNPEDPKHHNFQSMKLERRSVYGNRPT